VPACDRRTATLKRCPAEDEGAARAALFAWRAGNGNCTGSSALLISAGSRESLAGRFERTVLAHWCVRSLARTFHLPPHEAARESLEDVRGEWSEQVLSLAVERFERRLVEETSKLRVEMAQGFGGLRQEMSSLEGRLRQEMGGLEGRLRQEMGGLEGRLHKEIGGQRVESLRWSFVFWIGQVAAMAALLGFMLRGLRG
jgi:hypothetical protein